MVTYAEKWNRGLSAYKSIRNMFSSNQWSFQPEMLGFLPWVARLVEMTALIPLSDRQCLPNPWKMDSTPVKILHLETESPQRI